jgi:hypothetical protein
MRKILMLEDGENLNNTPRRNEIAEANFVFQYSGNGQYTIHKSRNGTTGTVREGRLMVSLMEHILPDDTATRTWNQTILPTTPISLDYRDTNFDEEGLIASLLAADMETIATPYSGNDDPNEASIAEGSHDDLFASLFADLPADTADTADTAEEAEEDEDDEDEEDKEVGLPRGGDTMEGFKAMLDEIDHVKEINSNLDGIEL